MARPNRAAKPGTGWSEDIAAQEAQMMQTKENSLNRSDDLPAEAEPDAFVDELKQGTILLNGQYTIMGFLNSGGFGITYLAKDSLDRTVVIKECFPNSLCRRSETIVRARSRAHTGEFRSVVKLFVQEARSLSKLVHPNIVGVHQVFEDNDTAYMAIDYVNGKDLLEILDSSDQPFTPSEIVEMLKKTLGAVEFIHQAGILHRDISPDNILIDAHQNPILIDFGAAREQISKASRVLSARRVVKDGYSPQEFYLTGSAQGPYSDLYALAATFYHVIAGSAPPESQRRLAAIAEGNPDPYDALTGRYPGYPVGFLESIDKAAHVLPKDRIDTAANWLALISDSKAAPVAQSSSMSSLRARSRIMTNMITPAAVVEAAEASKLPLLIGSTAMAALALGIGVWMMVGGDADPVAAIAAPAVVADPAASVAADASATAAAEADAQAEAAEQTRLATAAKAEADARTAAEAAAKEGEDARLAAEAAKAEEETRLAAAAKAEEDARLAAEAKAAAKAEEQARLAAEAKAAAVAAEEARLVAEAEAQATAKAEAEAEAIAAEVAAAEAAVAVRSAALAAVTPRPALADTPLVDDQFSEVRWDYGLPFRTEVREIDGDTFPVITKVIASALSGTADDAWIVPGVTIFAINGEWVTDGAAIDDLMRVSTTPDEYGLVSAQARIRATEDGLFEEVPLVAPTTRWVSLKNGTTVRSVSVDGKWRAVVDMITYSDENGILPDDVILGETTLGKTIDNAESFEVIIDLLAFKSIPEASFDVLRNGEQVTVRMPLARQ
jgi:serine/threonine protein kinase